MNKNKLVYITLLSMILLTSCRGWLTEKPPVHPNPNLDWQPKYTAQKYIGKTPENTIQYNQSKKISSLKTGKYNNQYIKKIPIPVTMTMINKGEESYNINCSTCHTKTGNGTKSLIAKRGWIPSNLLLETTMKRSDGELFNIIGYGIRSMPGYAKKIDIDTRWAIVAYVRSLQQVKTTKYYQLNPKDKKEVK